MASKVRLWRVTAYDFVWRVNHEKVILAPNIIDAIEKAQASSSDIFSLQYIIGAELVAEED